MKRFFVMAALATLTSTAYAEEAAQNKSEDANATTTVAAAPATPASPAAATGTSSSTLQDPEASIKGKWSFNALAQAKMTSSDVNYSSNLDKSVNLQNAIGLGYKLDKDNRLGFKQYFDFSHDGVKKTNTAKLSYPALTYGHTFKGLANSEPVSALFWYYLPVTENDYKTQNNGILRLDAEFAWTLTPKWSVSYYLNPRQSLIPTETTLEVEGQAAPAFAKTTLIHYGSVYYSVNDAISYYLNVGYYHAWKTSNFSLAKEQFLTNLGASFTFLGGKLNIMPEVDYAVTLPQNRENIQVASTYSEDNLSYVLSAAVVF